MPPLLKIPRRRVLFPHKQNQRPHKKETILREHLHGLKYPMPQMLPIRAYRLYGRLINFYLTLLLIYF